MKISKFKKLVTCLMFIIIFLCPKAVYADFGPKDSLDVHVKNPPNEPYYLDLLFQISDKSGVYDDLPKDDRQKALNQDMLKLLYSYEKEGWIPAYASSRIGAGVPIWGDLIGKENNNERIHSFGYSGVPKTYKIIIVTQSGKVSVSDVHTRQVLQSSVTYDYSNGKTTVPPIIISYIVQYLSTYIPTLIIEGIILLLFGFKLKENWKPFLLINAFTQVILTLTVGIALIKGGFGFFTYVIQFPIEVIILIFETVLFQKYLIGKSKGRRCAYGITANIVSWAVGLFLLYYQWELVFNFL